ncbi:MAG: ribosome maturation factor RimM [Sulfurovum sp. FS06-10]|jgi:16S rRNA processing protein RimM|nr:MAG: ribosome maturation factor RimM [Sulfurovum sp. FS06-10]
MNNSKRFFIAQVGKTVALQGDLKLHLHTDFPEQFKVGEIFESSNGPLEISRINLNRELIAFKGYDGIDAAKRLINTKLYASLEETKKRCILKKGEYFWFDLEECLVVEKGEVLGKVTEIQRFADTNYLFIQTNEKLVKEGYAKTFLVPNISRYVLNCDIDAKIINTIDSKELLSAS